MIRVAALTAMMVLALVLLAPGPAPAAAAAGAPTVNGLFFGDGDNDLYVPYATSEYGSILYLYFDNPTLYVALVVDRSVNDNTFSPNKAYTQSAGMNPPRPANKLYDSEFAAFTFECQTAPLSWTWQMGYAGKPGSTWIADHTVGGGLGTPPAGIVSASSLAWNLNTYEAKQYPNDVPWDMYVNGTGEGDWKSPFDPNNPDTVPGLDGYPVSGPIGYSTQYEWEWPMVYEWSVDLGALGCGGNPLFLVTGKSHHSPSKVGDDENDDFPSSDTPTPLYDFGDLPDTYGTLEASGGPAHIVTVDGARLGALAPDIEPDGQPTFEATGDGDSGASDEDGLTLVDVPNWTNGNTVSVNLDVQGTTEDNSADIGMWIDWNGDGDFADADEFYAYLDRPTGAVANESLVVPDTSIYTTGNPLNFRVRIMNDEADAPGGTLDAGDYVGSAGSGEVEDHRFYFSPTAVTLNAAGIGAVNQWLPLVAAFGFLLTMTLLVVLQQARVRVRIN